MEALPRIRNPNTIGQELAISITTAVHLTNSDLLRGENSDLNTDYAMIIL